MSDFDFGLGVASIKNRLIFKEKQNIIIDTNGNKIVDLPKEWALFKPVSEKLFNRHDKWVSRRKNLWFYGLARKN